MQPTRLRFAPAGGWCATLGGSTHDPCEINPKIANLSKFHILDISVALFSRPTLFAADRLWRVYAWRGLPAIVLVIEACLARVGGG
jgi:hypothetical protein